MSCHELSILISESSSFEAVMNLAPHKAALLYFSHLRWDFVHQRPPHLLGKAGTDFHVCYFDEPEFAQSELHFRMKAVSFHASSAWQAGTFHRADAITFALRVS